MTRFYFSISILVFSTLAALPVHGYVTRKGLSSSKEIVQLRWASQAFPITWQMDGTAGANVSGSRPQIDIARQSFQAWASIPTAAVTFKQGPLTTASNPIAYDGQNVVSTNITPAQWADFGVGSDVIAFTELTWFDEAGSLDALGRSTSFPGQLTEADIVFNPAYQLTTENDPQIDKVDLQSVLTHEIGHLLGLEHSPIVASTMFWTVGTELTRARTLSTDDVAGISTIYPTPLFSSKARLSGTVRTTSNLPVFGAIVVAINASGQPVASTLTDVQGNYLIMGLDPGTYTIYAEPFDGPTDDRNIATFSEIYPDKEVNTHFRLRFR